MEITNESTDETILGELGGRLARVRLEKNLTQAQLAERAGVSKRTVERLESGGAAPQLTGFIGICRALGLAGRFELLAPGRDMSERPNSVAGADVADDGGWKRRRASAARGAPRARGGEAERKTVERKRPTEPASEDGSLVGGEGQAAPSVVVVAHALN